MAWWIWVDSRHMALEVKAGEQVCVVIQSAECWVGWHLAL